jgi:hypothetical protein
VLGGHSGEPAFFYGTGKFTPEQVRQEETRLWKHWVFSRVARGEKCATKRCRGCGSSVSGREATTHSRNGQRPAPPSQYVTRRSG